MIHENKLDDFKNNILKRINRFYKLKNPIFVRIEINNLSENQMKKYKKLQECLDKIFDNYEIKLISKIKYETNKIKWYNLVNFSSNWKYNHLNWETIFK